MYFNKPVMIPKAPGKITLGKKGENTYVQYEIRRKYDPNKKYNVPERVGIGVQIPGQPELMLPNENYLTYFPKEETKRINKVLEPIMSMLKNEAYAGFLELIPEPEIQEDEDGTCVLTGLSYSDVSLLLTQFKGALNRYFQKKL